MNESHHIRMSRSRWLMTLSGAVVVALTGLMISGVGSSVEARADDRSITVDEQLRYALNVSEAFQEVSRSIAPSVVSINTAVQVTQRQPGFGGDPMDDLMERFFEGMPPQFRPMRPTQPQQPQQRLRRGQGSGVIVSEDGFIVTNYHVIAQADEISVRLTDGREYTAEVVGEDPETDLAVLRIEPDASLIAARFGDSEALRAGEWVLAVGNALGFEHTVTSGIVSATGRGGLGLALYENFIQTDAAINPGNSGGPLVNLYGEVVGINTAIASRTGGHMGIGFAIPSSMAEPVVRSIIDSGSVVRGFLGITMNPLTEELAQSLGYEGTNGVAVADIAPDSPAEQTGVRIGDVITHVNDRPVLDIDELRHAIALFAPGTEVELRLVRQGRELTQSVTLTARPTMDELASEPRSEPSDTTLGLTVQEITPEIARQLGMRSPRGVVVRDVVPRSISAQAGIRPNDVILTVGDQEIRTMEDYRRAMGELDYEQGVRLRVQRGNMVQFYVLRSR